MAAAVAGRLDYPHYRWLDRQIIRFIMKMTGGPTDPRSCVEFTAWKAVDRDRGADCRVAWPRHGSGRRRRGPTGLTAATPAPNARYATGFPAAARSFSSSARLRGTPQR